MRADAILGVLAGVVIVAGAGPLSSFTGIPKSVEYVLGAGFILAGLAGLGLAGLRRVRPAGLGAVIANLAYTVAVVVVAVADVFALTTAGIVFVIATGIYTLAAAELQYVGVRRIRA